MTSLKFMLALGGMLFLLAGCGNGYEQAQLSPASPEGREIAAMLGALRQADDKTRPEVMARQSAGELSPPQAAGLEALLKKLAGARETKLVSLDRFGRQILRAGVEVTEQGPPVTLHVLLIEKDGRLLWAGLN